MKRLGRMVTLAMMLTLACGMATQAQTAGGEPSSSGNAPLGHPAREVEPAGVQEARREIGRLLAEQRRLRARHQALQKAATRAAAVLQRQGNEGAREALAVLEEALREEARAPREPEETPTPAASADIAKPANPADPLSNNAGGGYFYGQVRFEQTPEGVACIGQIVNTNGDAPSVATFVLTTLDDAEKPLESARIYVGMPKPAQPRVFRVMLTQKPPTGKFSLKYVEAE